MLRVVHIRNKKLNDNQVSVVRVLVANHVAAVCMHHIYKMQSRQTSSEFSASLCSEHS